MPQAILRAQLQSIITLRRAGMSCATIAGTLGVDEGKIYQLCEIQGVPFSDEMPAKAQVRSCLRCTTPFISTGIGHRLCQNCRGPECSPSF